MRKGRLGAVACGAMFALSALPALAVTRATPSAAVCSTSIAFDTPNWRQQAMTFRATVDIACPLGVAFSAALRSSSGCELRSRSGSALRYELFSDAAMQAPIVSCEREAGVLSGSGRRSFVVFGRVEGPVAAIGQFHDALSATITI
jgi:spore coat protein U-like protein